jgi:hypothetical protein
LEADVIYPSLQVPRLALKTKFRDGTIQDIAKQVPSCCHLCTFASTCTAAFMQCAQRHGQESVRLLACNWKFN